MESIVNAFYAAQRFITLFTTASHYYLTTKNKISTSHSCYLFPHCLPTAVYRLFIVYPARIPHHTNKIQ